MVPGIIYFFAKRIILNHFSRMMSEKNYSLPHELSFVMILYTLSAMPAHWTSQTISTVEIVWDVELSLYCRPCRDLTHDLHNSTILWYNPAVFYWLDDAIFTNGVYRRLLYVQLLSVVGRGTRLWVSILGPLNFTEEEYSELFSPVELFIFHPPTKELFIFSSKKDYLKLI